MAVSAVTAKTRLPGPAGPPNLCNRDHPVVRKQRHSFFFCFFFIFLFASRYLTICWEPSKTTGEITCAQTNTTTTRVSKNVYNVRRSEQKKRVALLVWFYAWMMLCAVQRSQMFAHAGGCSNRFCVSVVTPKLTSVGESKKRGCWQTLTHTRGDWPAPPPFPLFIRLTPKRGCVFPVQLLIFQLGFPVVCIGLSSFFIWG